MNPLVSIIVPVYNVEKTLDRCLEKIVAQTYSEIEIVLVDDGSKDSSGEICEIWKEKDNRIKVVHKRNEGLGEARNTGIENSTGKYVCFCDSDDYISTSTIEKCVGVAEKNKAEIVHYGFHLLDTNLNEHGLVISDKEYIFAQDEIRERFIPGMLGRDPKTGKAFGVWMSLCGSFISLDLIHKNNWKCESERKIISEDMYSLLELYSHVRKVCIIPQAFYYYIQNNSSLSHVFRPDRYEKIERFYYSCVERCKEFDYEDECVRLISRYYIDYTISALKQIAKSNLKSSEKFNEIREIENSELAKKIFKEATDDRLSKKIFILFMKNRWTLGVWALCALK